MLLIISLFKVGCGLQKTMETRFAIVNLFRGRAFYHQGFLNCLNAFDVEYGDVLFYKYSLEKSAGEDEERAEEPKQVLVVTFNKRFVEFASIDDVCCFFANPFNTHPDVCQKSSQTFDVAERFTRFQGCVRLETRLSMKRTTWCCSGQRKYQFGFQREAVHKLNEVILM